MRPVNQRFDRFTLSLDYDGGVTMPAIRFDDDDFQRGEEGESNHKLPFNFGEAELFRDWLNDYLEAGGR